MNASYSHCGGVVLWVQDRLTKQDRLKKPHTFFYDFLFAIFSFGLITRKCI